MASIYKKTMREALQEARDYRDTSDIEEGYPMSYDKWLKKEKGIKKGAYGVNSDEHAKYSAEWRASVGKHYNNLPSAKGAKNVTKLSPTAHTKLGENELDEIVGGQGEMTVTKDGGVMIIKTRDWQTYKAKGWVKREEVENESLDLPATGDTITSNASQEVEGEELTEGRVILAVDKKTKKKWQFSGGMTVKHNGKQYKTEGVTTQQVLELTASFGTLKLGKKDIEDGFAKGNFSVVDDGRVWQPWKNDFEPEGEQVLDEASRIRPIKGLWTMAQMKKQVARTEKAFREFEQHCDFIFQMDADIGPSMGDNSGKYWNVHKVLDNANNQIKKALADAKKIT